MNDIGISQSSDAAPSRVGEQEDLAKDNEDLAKRFLDSLLSSSERKSIKETFSKPEVALDSSRSGGRSAKPADESDSSSQRTDARQETHQEKRDRPLEQSPDPRQSTGSREIYPPRADYRESRALLKEAGFGNHSFEDYKADKRASEAKSNDQSETAAPTRAKKEQKPLEEAPDSSENNKVNNDGHMSFADYQASLRAAKK